MRTRIITAVLLLLVLTCAVQASGVCKSNKYKTDWESLGSHLYDFTNPGGTDLNEVYGYQTHTIWALSWKDNFAKNTGDIIGLGQLGHTSFCSADMYCKATFGYAAFFDEDVNGMTVGTFQQDVFDHTYGGHSSACAPFCGNGDSGTIYESHMCMAGGD